MQWNSWEIGEWGGSLMLGAFQSWPGTPCMVENPGQDTSVWLSASPVTQDAPGSKSSYGTVDFRTVPELKFTQ